MTPDTYNGTTATPLIIQSPGNGADGERNDDGGGDAE